MGVPAPSPIDGLTERERACVELLASGKTVRETARTIGVTEKTIWNYRQKIHVQEAIYRRQTDDFDRSGGHGISLLPEVVKALQAIVRGKDEKGNPVIRETRDVIAASRVLISSANEYQARRQLERQIADLEARLFGDIRPTPATGKVVPRGGQADPDPPEDDAEEPSGPVVDVDAAMELLSDMSPAARNRVREAAAPEEPPAAALVAAAPPPSQRLRRQQAAAPPPLTDETPLQRRVRLRREAALAEASGEADE